MVAIAWLPSRPLRVEIVLAHHQPGPDELQQFFLGDEPIAVLDQRQQQVERACAQRRSLSPHE